MFHSTIEQILSKVLKILKMTIQKSKKS